MEWDACSLISETTYIIEPKASRVCKLSVSKCGPAVIAKLLYIQSCTATGNERLHNFWFGLEQVADGSL
jgi:hypothetical protein